MIYKLPIMGGIKDDAPLRGVDGNPLIVIPLEELPGFDKLTGGLTYQVLNYDIESEMCDIELDADEEIHNWLIGLIPSLKQLAKDKGWKLDKTELEKTRKARAEKLEKPEKE
jgi:hypothetical protein